MGLQVVDVPSGDVFVFSADETLETDVDTGFGDAGGSDAGLLAGVET